MPVSNSFCPVAFCLRVVYSCGGVPFLDEHLRIFGGLEADEALWRVMDFIPDAVLIVGAGGAIVYANRQVDGMFGYRRDELVGQPVETLIPERYREVHNSHLSQYFRSPRIRSMGEGLDLSARRRDGGEFPAEISLGPLQTSAGLLVIASIRDITARRRAEEEVRLAQADKNRFHALSQQHFTRLGAVLETIVAGIVMFDNADRCVVVNRNFARFIAVDTGDLLGRSRPEVHEQVTALFREPDIMLPGTPEGIRTVTTKGEQPRYFSVYWKPVFGGGGETIGRIFAFRDVTRETEVERLKSEFIATVSHELRTPMTSVKGALSLLLGGAAGAVPDEQKELLTIARNNAERLIRLINDILDLSAVESGRLRLRSMALDINNVVTTAIRSLDSVRAERQIDLQTHLTGDLPLVQADPDRIGQVVVNLLDNAYKFTGAGGRVTVRSERLGQEVRVRVSDTGPGIAEHELESIFERFQRASSGASYKAGGTGLGLAIARTIVQEHHGRIWAESTLGKGATFTFTLPVQAVKGQTDKT